jgi:hypothetical protein
MSRYDEVFQKALDNTEHPLSEITRRNTYRARSPGVKPMTGIKLNLPKTSSMAEKMQKILDDESAEGRKKQKQMANLVIGREEDGNEISLEFKTSASRERFRKMMNEGVEVDEDSPCWDDYVQRGMKKKGDRLVPNCVPKNEDVQLDENVQNQVKRMDRRAKQKLADKLNDLDLSGYGDYEARVDNVHKFKPSDLKMAMEMMSLKEAESLKWTGMKNTEREELVRLAKVPARVTEMKWREIPNPLKERLAKYINKSTKGEFALVEERAKVPTYVIDRKTKKIVYGPTDTADAKLYLDKQITPRKFMVRQIRGAAKKVGDKV